MRFGCFHRVHTVDAQLHMCYALFRSEPFMTTAIEGLLLYWPVRLLFLPGMQPTVQLDGDVASGTYLRLCCMIEKHQAGVSIASSVWSRVVQRVLERWHPLHREEASAAQNAGARCKCHVRDRARTDLRGRAVINKKFSSFSIEQRAKE